LFRIEQRPLGRRRYVAGKDTNIGAKRARQTREALGLDPSAPLQCLLTVVASRLALPVVVAALPAGVAGCCWRDGDRVMLWVNGSDAPARQRFTLAHELGHVRCGHDGAIPVETFVTLGGKATDAREIQANAFAAELLAPAAGVRGMVDGADPGLEEVVRIAARFGISTIAALYRLNSLRLLRRYEELAAAIGGGEDAAVWQRLGLAPPTDAIASIQPSELPWLSAALHGSALAAVAHGSASTTFAAQATGCDPAAMASAAASIGI
jgi:Zn-dependent peptidase ImmA (M78 family)